MTALSEIITVDPRSDARWDVFAHGQHGSLFVSPPWLDAVCSTYGFTPEARLTVNDAGEPVGGFAWVPVSDLRGERLCSLPFCDRAEPVAADEPAWHALVEGLLTHDTRLTLRCLESAAPTWDSRLRFDGAAAWHATRLDRSIDALHGDIGSSARRNTAAADRNGIRVVASEEIEAVRCFHRLHVRLRKRKYRLLAQPLEFFERIWQRFAPNDSVVTLLAFADGDAVAGAMFLVWNRVLYYKFGASDPECLALRPNDALYWAGIRWGVERGLRLLDWGLSDLGQPGLVRYKRKWASEEQRIVTLRSAGQPSRAQAEAARTVGELTRLLTEESVPDDITTKAGALLYRYFC
jgi:CelD/BcsL family acetyltransferase involved in cellulose biosynthesis